MAPSHNLGQLDQFFVQVVASSFGFCIEPENKDESYDGKTRKKVTMETGKCSRKEKKMNLILWKISTCRLQSLKAFENPVLNQHDIMTPFSPFFFLECPIHFLISRHFTFLLN